ncbi:MAG: S-methyl-5-thioribose kinase [Bacillaceae bacterium]|uniref:S-methyl-5-thioribose kinase n=1 Tax=Aeribacillus TaxID=1055323 RepID=UPI000E3B31A2|nr:S-methyl-5-thioribose kinase [Aeribacillus composti]AXI38413.1 S-methyl-5-thioribose kinase [Bacillaceae bacterium ZC4]REJ13381.1 MAG: S-methyl-5-thioribose kinase [Bacillaceae bacterium]MED0714199.1 S-methyl-5-thioribose kinase [Aeribacillus composti]MED0745384.1 S-methyl-5-thioribose kinase [Aeribacillus composti]REJ23131.1 MAG: S-methyl-5-thioribose kinase [Bacillaceae bacterium]
MKDFTTYFTMTEQDVIEYVQKKLDIFEQNAELECREIGDGNLNYVFRVVDQNSGQSVIIKQAGPVARISDAFKVSPDRNRIESEALKLQGELAPGFVPKVYSYDPIMNCCVMDDLSDHEIMRTALLKHKKFPLFADHITTFLVNTLLLTSDAVIDHKEKKALVQKFTNPELCEITEDLVYTEPFYDCEQNDVFPETREFIREEIWNDSKLALETAKLKFDFMTKAQSLLHGDLHTGSIFIKEDSTKIIDPEFAFYGPAGFDIGNVIANLIFAYVNASFTIEDQETKEDYLQYIQQTISDVIELFTKKFLHAWDENIKERTASAPSFKEWYLNSILEDASAAAGLELCRRIIGIAHVKDITSIENKESRALAEKICLTAGKTFILERANIRTGDDFVNVLLQSVRKFIEGEKFYDSSKSHSIRTTG